MQATKPRLTLEQGPQTGGKSAHRPGDIGQWPKTFFSATGIWWSRPSMLVHILHCPENPTNSCSTPNVSITIAKKTHGIEIWRFCDWCQITQHMGTFPASTSVGIWEACTWPWSLVSQVWSWLWYALSCDQCRILALGVHYLVAARRAMSSAGKDSECVRWHPWFLLIPSCFSKMGQTIFEKPRPPVFFKTQLSRRWP